MQFVLGRRAGYTAHAHRVRSSPPHVASQWDADMEAALLERLADPRTAALGEVGLDYHYRFVST